VTGSGGPCGFGVAGWGSEEAVAEERGALVQEELCALNEEGQE